MSSVNKMILIPEEIYRGLISTDTGNINLDFTRRSLENVKKEKTDSTTKNARYNQELRRYLHLRKEHEEKPVKVELTGTPELKLKEEDKTGDETALTEDLEGRTPTSSRLKTPKTPAGEFINEFISKIKEDPRKYNTDEDGYIYYDSGKVIEGSNLNKSLNWIIAKMKGNKVGYRPRGTMVLEGKIEADKSLKELLENGINIITPSSSYLTPTKKFTPKKWEKK
jgi:hypothetical protein